MRIICEDSLNIPISSSNDQFVSLTSNGHSHSLVCSCHTKYPNSHVLLDPGPVSSALNMRNFPTLIPNGRYRHLSHKNERAILVWKEWMTPFHFKYENLLKTLKHGTGRQNDAVIDNVTLTSVNTFIT